MSFIESSDTSRKVRQFFFGLAIFTILSFQTVQARDDDYSVSLNFIQKKKLNNERINLLREIISSIFR